MLFAPVVAFGVGVRAKAIENRPLAELPKAADGWRIFPEMTAYATDRLPLREHAIDLNDRLIEGVFGQPPVKASSGGPAVGGPAAAGSLDNLFPSVIEGKDGWLYLGGDMRIPCLATRPVGETVSELTALRDVVEKSGRRFVFVVAPDKSSVVPEHLPDDYPGKRCARERKAEMWDALGGIEGREDWLIDLREPLLDRQAADGADIYRPNDTHWTPRGGAVFGQELLGVLSPGPHRLRRRRADGGAESTGRPGGPPRPRHHGSLHDVGAAATGGRADDGAARAGAGARAPALHHDRCAAVRARGRSSSATASPRPRARCSTRSSRT